MSIWIFGDSFCDHNDHFPESWPHQLTKHYTVKNFAMPGSGLDWSMNKMITMTGIEPQDILMCWLTDPWRQNWRMFDSPKDQTIIPLIASESKNAIPIDKAQYYPYKDFFKTFIRNVKNNFTDIEYKKHIGYINSRSHQFAKVLIIPCFYDIDISDMQLNSNVTIAEGRMIDYESANGDDHYYNHLPKHKHKEFFNYITNYIDKNIRPCLK